MNLIVIIILIVLAIVGGMWWYKKRDRFIYMGSNLFTPVLSEMSPQCLNFPGNKTCTINGEQGTCGVGGWCVKNVVFSPL